MNWLLMLMYGLLIVGVTVTIVMLISIIKQGKFFFDYKSTLDEIKGRMNLIEKFLTPATIEQLAKREEIEKLRELSKNLSEKITELKTLVDERGQSQFTISQSSRDNISKVNDIVVSIKEKIESIEKKSEPIMVVNESAQFIKDRITELYNKLLGAKEKGLIGEKVLYEQLSAIPNNWLKRDVEFEGGVKVEFAIAIDDKFIPIDSKVIEVKNEKEVYRKLLDRADEIRKYLRSNKSLGFAIMAIPDALKEEGLKASSKVLDQNIIIVPYSYLMYIVLFMIANKDRILVNMNSQKILMDLPAVPHLLAEAIKKAESAQNELTAARNRISELRDNLDKCYKTIDNILSNKQN